MKRSLLTAVVTNLLRVPVDGTSLFYVARSLGNEVDISDALKHEIASVQAPTKGISALPSKSYHIYGAALFSCLMKSQGLSNEEITAAEFLLRERTEWLICAIAFYRKNIKRWINQRLEQELRRECKHHQGTCPAFFNGQDYDQAGEDKYVASKMVEFDSYVSNKPLEYV